MAMVSLEREHNERDRVLSSEEFRCLHDTAALWLQPMLLVAYYTGMRQEKSGHSAGTKMTSNA